MKFASSCTLALAVIAACGGTDSSRVPPPTAPDPVAQQPPSPQAGCGRTSVGLTALTDLGRGVYKGEPGGLYGRGGNVRPGSHDTAGQGLARRIRPLDQSGAPAASGRYVFVSIGMSNTTQEFSTFKPLADGDPMKDPHLTIVDGAQGGMTATDWASPACGCWATLNQRLAGAGVTPQQVAIAWVKLAERNPTAPFPQHAIGLKDNTAAVLRLLRSRFPNLTLAYLSSRIYAGYATTTLNPEPYAYESAFAVRWLIDDQIGGVPGLNFDPTMGAVVAPWLSWGPYLWADGLTPRGDGLTWACSDLSNDGTHPSASGRRKVADQLLAFLKDDSTAREWYLGNP